MSMMMMSIDGKRIICGGLLVLGLLSVVFFSIRAGGKDRGRQQPVMQTFQSGNGWGYKILLNEKVLIYQPTIPAIDTEKPFPTKESAQAVGSLVLDRLLKRQDIAVSISEISTFIQL